MKTFNSVLLAALLTAVFAACTKKVQSSCTCSYEDGKTGQLFKNTGDGSNCLNHSNEPIGDTVTINGSVFIKACQETVK